MENPTKNQRTELHAGGDATFVRTDVTDEDQVRARFSVPGPAGDASQEERARRRWPFGVGQPIEIATIALFLASDESRMIQGTAIPADGGMSYS